MTEPLTTLDVTITRVSEKGFKVAEGDRWLNWSRFASDHATLLVGARVRVTLDGREFVRAVEIVEAPKPAPGAASSESALGEPIALTLGIQQDDRGTVISRMNVLSTATAILSSGGRATDVEAVIELAERLEKWITR
jgi:hypothetical protein